MMKKSILILLISLVYAFQVSVGQTAQQPSIMVVPNEAWCIDKGYVTTFTDPITEMTQQTPDYRKAVNDQELIMVIAKMNELFSERGFPLKNMQTTLQKLDRDRAADLAMGSKSGASMNKSALDELNEEAKADIVLSITWVVNEIGPKRSLAFTMQALDSYTSKQVGGASGTGPQSFSSEMSILLQEAVLSHVENMQAQMQEHFDDLRMNGRQINLRLRVWDDAMYDLETECGDDDDELIDIIYDWLAENAQGGVFTEGDVTETRAEYNDVRIPLFDEKGRATNPRRFGRDLSKHLRKVCPDADDSGIKVLGRGLGEVWLVLGGK
jgi:hypothetical protein